MSASPVTSIAGRRNDVQTSEIDGRFNKTNEKKYCLWTAVKKEVAIDIWLKIRRK